MSPMGAGAAITIPYWSLIKKFPQVFSTTTTKILKYPFTFIVFIKLKQNTTHF